MRKGGSREALYVSRERSLGDDTTTNATRRIAWVLFFLSAVIIVLLLLSRLCEILFYTLRFPAEKLKP